MDYFWSQRIENVPMDAVAFDYEPETARGNPLKWVAAADGPAVWYGTIVGNYIEKYEYSVWARGETRAIHARYSISNVH